MEKESSGKIYSKNTEHECTKRASDLRAAGVIEDLGTAAAKTAHVHRQPRAAGPDGTVAPDGKIAPDATRGF